MLISCYPSSFERQAGFTHIVANDWLMFFSHAGYRELDGGAKILNRGNTLKFYIQKRGTMFKTKYGEI